MTVRALLLIPPCLLVLTALGCATAEEKEPPSPTNLADEKADAPHRVVDMGHFAYCPRGFQGEEKAEQEACEDRAQKEGLEPLPRMLPWYGTGHWLAMNEGEITEEDEIHVYQVHFDSLCERDLGVTAWANGLGYGAALDLVLSLWSRDDELIAAVDDNVGRSDFNHEAYSLTAEELQRLGCQIKVQIEPYTGFWTLKERTGSYSLSFRLSESPDYRCDGVFNFGCTTGD